jgi:hypothetical protein
MNEPSFILLTRLYTDANHIGVGFIPGNSAVDFSVTCPCFEPTAFA